MKYILLILLIPCGLFSQREIANPNQPTRWVAWDSTENVTVSGTTDPGQVTTTGQPSFLFDSTALGFLEKTQGMDLPYDTLPPTGSPLLAGEIYKHNGKYVIVRQDHDRTIYAPADVPALFAVYRSDGEGLAWIPNEEVYTGMIRTYNGKNYRALIGFLTITGQTPDLLPALWTEVRDETACAPWVQQDRQTFTGSGIA